MMGLARQITTVLGAGRAPIASGTVGSLAALPFAWLLLRLGGPWLLLVATAIATLIGWWAIQKQFGGNTQDDPSEVVIDELAGQWLALGGFALLVAALTPLMWLWAFIGFRVMDIIKPWACQLGR